MYIAFGQAWGYIGPPGQGQWLNVHGAGAQRSDPKNDDPANYPYGRGPQGDEVRVFNYVRCVRGGSSGTGEETGSASKKCHLCQNSPNPFTTKTTFMFTLPHPDHIQLSLFNCAGQKVITLFDGYLTAGYHTVPFAAKTLSGGVYFYCLETDGGKQTRKCIVLDEEQGMCLLNLYDLLIQ